MTADAFPAPDRAAHIARAATRFCLLHGWAPVPEVPLPNGRRADLLALRPDGCFAILEVKSCARDFLTDRKWPEYRAFCDHLYFAVDTGFPTALLPADTGLLVTAEGAATLLRQAPAHPLAPARRRALLLRFARIAAGRLAAAADPAGTAELRAALLVE